MSAKHLEISPAQAVITIDDFTTPVTIGNRRGFTGLQIAASPRLRAFINAHPDLFEPGPINYDVILIAECPKR
jgi:hypothetical protein